MSSPPSPTSLQAVHLPYNGAVFFLPNNFFGNEGGTEEVSDGDPLFIHPQKVYKLEDVFPKPIELVEEGWQYTTIAPAFEGWTNPFSFECKETNEFSHPIVDKTDELNLRLAYYLAELVSNHYSAKVASIAWNDLCALGEPSDFRYSITFRPLCLMTRKVHQTLVGEWGEILTVAHEAQKRLDEAITKNTVPLINTNPSLYTSMDLVKFMGVNIQQETLSRAKSQQHLLKYLLLAVQHQQEISLQALHETIVKDFFPPETSPDLWFRPFSAIEDTVDDTIDYVVLSRPHPLAQKEQDFSKAPFTEIFPDRSMLSKEGWEKSLVSNSFQGWGSSFQLDGGELTDSFKLPFCTQFEALIHRLDGFLREIVTNRWLAKVLLEAHRQMTVDPGSPGFRVPTYPCTEPFRILFLLARKNHQNCVSLYSSLRGDADKTLLELNRVFVDESEPSRARCQTIKTYLKSLLEAIESQQNLETYALASLSTVLTKETSFDEGWMFAGKYTVDTMDAYVKSLSDLFACWGQILGFFRSFFDKRWVSSQRNSFYYTLHLLN